MRAVRLSPIRVFSVTGLALFCTGLQAQSAAPEPSAALPTMVVTGTRTELLLSDSPVRTEVITREQIERSHAVDLKQVLEMVPGLSLSRLHGKAGYEVWMQGVDGNRVLVLIDGYPTARSTNNATDLTQLGVADIEQVEIVKGAVSALYGSNAIGGVINVITRRPDQPLDYSVSGALGSYGSQNIESDTAVGRADVQGRIALKGEHWDSQLSLDWRDAEGFMLERDDPTKWAREGGAGSRLNSRASVAWLPDALSRHEIETAWFEEDLTERSVINAGGKQTQHRKIERTERQTYAAGSDVAFADSALRWRYVFEDTRNETEQDALASAFVDQGRSADLGLHFLDVQADRTWRAGHITTLGLTVQHDDLAQEQWKQTAPGVFEYGNELADADSSRQQHDLFAQDNFFVGEQLNLLPGVRVTHSNGFGTELTPKLNGRYDLPAAEGDEHFLRFGVGRGYRSPSIKEMFYVFDHRQHGYMVYGNEALQPESSVSWQLGWGLVAAEGLLVDLNLFHNRLKNYIETGIDDAASTPELQIHRYINIGRAQTQGFEALGQFRLSDSWETSLGYTWLEAKDLILDTRLPKTSRHQFKSSLDWTPETRNFTLTLLAQWRSDQFYDPNNGYRTPGYSTFDLKLNVPEALNLGSASALSLFAGIDNLGNTQREFDPFLYDQRPEAGRYLYLGVRLHHL